MDKQAFIQMTRIMFFKLKFCLLNKRNDLLIVHSYFNLFLDNWMKINLSFRRCCELAIGGSNPAWDKRFYMNEFIKLIIVVPLYMNGLLKKYGIDLSELETTPPDLSYLPAYL